MKIPDSWMQTGPYVINAVIIDLNISRKTGKVNFLRMTHQWFFYEENVEFCEQLYIMPDGTVNP